MYQREKNMKKWQECVSAEYTETQVLQDVQELITANYAEDELYAYLKGQVSEGNFQTMAESLQAMAEYARIYRSYKKFGKNEYIKKDLSLFPESLNLEVVFLHTAYYEEKTGEMAMSEE